MQTLFAGLYEYFFAADSTSLRLFLFSLMSQFFSFSFSLSVSLRHKQATTASSCVSCFAIRNQFSYASQAGKETKPFPSGGSGIVFAIVMQAAFFNMGDDFRSEKQVDLSHATAKAAICENDYFTWGFGGSYRRHERRKLIFPSCLCSPLSHSFVGGEKLWGEEVELDPARSYVGKCN